MKYCQRFFDCFTSLLMTVEEDICESENEAMEEDREVYVNQRHDGSENSEQEADLSTLLNDDTSASQQASYMNFL